MNAYELIEKIHVPIPNIDPKIAASSAGSLNHAGVNHASRQLVEHTMFRRPSQDEIGRLLYCIVLGGGYDAEALARIIKELAAQDAA